MSDIRDDVKILKKSVEKNNFDIADEIIEKVYPDIYNKGKGWWGEQRIPNWGILRGAIAKALTIANTTDDEYEEYNKANYVGYYCKDCGKPYTQCGGWH